jgi:Mg-chelatase subunit ChlD
MQGIKYSVDIVLCIDATGSMSSIIDRVKSNVLKFRP